MLPLERALSVYEQWLAAGKPTTKETLIASNPELAEFLEALVADPAELDRAVAAADTERRVLGDFGFARDVEQPGLTRSGTFAGTPHYASPEQTEATKDVDARADVWSLGATLYELLTGRQPFGGGSTADVLDRIRRVDPVDPLRLAPALSPHLAAIVMKALEKEPERRYQTAAAFGDDLRAFLEFRPVAARRASAMLRLRRWVRREPLRAALTAVLAFGVPALALVAGLLIANRTAIQVGAREIRRQEQEERLARLTMYLEAGEYVDALANADLAIAERPDDIEAHVLRTLVQVYSGEGDPLGDSRRRSPRAACRTATVPACTC